MRAARPDGGSGTKPAKDSDEPNDDSKEMMTTTASNNNNNTASAQVDPFVCGGPCVETRLEARLRRAVDSGAVCVARRRYAPPAAPRADLRAPGALTRARGRMHEAVAAGRLAVRLAGGRPAPGVTVRRSGGEAWTLQAADLALTATVFDLFHADADDCAW